MELFVWAFTGEYKNSYIDGKVEEWCDRISRLSEIAMSHPHAAFAAFIHGEQHRYTYFMRTIQGISENLKPLDKIIDEKFIPALFGRSINPEERELFALQVKEGGLGIRQNHQDSETNHWASKAITSPLISEIVKQSDTLPDEEKVRSARSETMAKIRDKQQKRIKSVKDKQSPPIQRKLLQISEPGASSWLGALPLSQYGFDLNKGEFQDALCLRYNKEMKNLPVVCACKKKFSVTHALNCHMGGFVDARHNNIRDFEAQMLKPICKDVETESLLQQVTNKTNYKKTAILTDGARLDVRARGFWRHGQNAFFDVRITNAECDSQVQKTVKSVLRKHENEKKNEYNRRVLEVEHGSFTPLVFTTSGAMGHECTKFHKTLAEKVSKKSGEKYEEVMRYIRLKTSFLIVKATLLCLRGSRSLKRTDVDVGGEDFSQSLRELGL